MEQLVCIETLLEKSLVALLVSYLQLPENLYFRWSLAYCGMFDRNLAQWLIINLLNQEVTV